MPTMVIPYLRPDLVDLAAVATYRATAPTFTQVLRRGVLEPGVACAGVARGHGRRQYRTAWAGTFVEFHVIDPVDWAPRQPGRLYALFRDGHVGDVTHGPDDEFGFPVDQFVRVP